MLLILAEKSARRRRGLTDALTLDLDSRTLYSRRYGLADRPDRIVEEGKAQIPEEWKSARRDYDSHRAQMDTYFIPIEEETGVAPPCGVIVIGDSKRHRIENTAELRSRVLDLADQIRAMRRRPDAPIPVSQPPPSAPGAACGIAAASGWVRP